MALPRLFVLDYTIYSEVSDLKFLCFVLCPVRRLVWWQQLLCVEWICRRYLIVLSDSGVLRSLIDLIDLAIFGTLLLYLETVISGMFFY